MSQPVANDVLLFRLHADCFCVRGPVQSLIYDLGRMRMYSIPTAYAELIEETQGKSLGFIRETLTPEAFGYFETVLDFLVANQIARLFKPTEPFLSLPTTIDSPSQIQNAIIDVDLHLHDFSRIIEELGILGCEFLQVRAFSKVFGIGELESVASAVERAGLRGLEFVVHYDRHLTHEMLASFLLDHVMVSKMIVHSAPETLAIPVLYPDTPVPKREVYYLARKIASCESCGHITRSMVTPPTTRSFVQLRQVNGCLYKKISIGSDGLVRNCPSIKDSFGAYVFGALSPVLSTPAFRDNWFRRKDQIQTCKDCEYRYACTDCRAYLQDSNNPLSKPAKCEYDPYSGKWLDSAGNKTTPDLRFQTVSMNLPESADYG